jgi:hypothetical protein
MIISSLLHIPPFVAVSPKRTFRDQHAMDNPAASFSWELYKQLLASKELTNYAAGAFFSPLSVYLALVLVLQGAGAFEFN